MNRSLRVSCSYTCSIIQFALEIFQNDKKSHLKAYKCIFREMMKQTDTTPWHWDCLFCLIRRDSSLEVRLGYRVCVYVSRGLKYGVSDYKIAMSRMKSHSNKKYPLFCRISFFVFAVFKWIFNNFDPTPTKTQWRIEDKKTFIIIVTIRTKGNDINKQTDGLQKAAKKGRK